MEEHGNFSDTHGETEQEDREATFADDYDERYDEQNRLCVICHERAKDSIENPDSDLCYDCRQECLRLRVPTNIKVFMALVLAVFLASLFGLFSILPVYKQYVEADRQMKAREYVFAYNNYSKLLEDDGDSLDVAFKATDAAISAQYFDSAADLFNEHIIGKNLSDSKYDTASEYMAFLEGYYMTMDEIEAIFNEMSEAGDIEDAEAFVKALHSKLNGLLEREDMNKAIIYYYLGSYSTDSDSALEYLRLASDTDPRVTFPLSFYGNALRHTGKLDEARQVYNRGIELNATDALSIRGLSILSLLDGDKAFALEEMRRAYDIEPYGLYMAEALIISLCENGLRDEAMMVLEEQLGSAEPDLQSYLDGGMSLKEYYIKGEQA